jgi:hypothetical protein
MTDERSLKDVCDEVHKAFDHNFNHFAVDFHKWIRTAFDYFVSLKMKMITK